MPSGCCCVEGCSNKKGHVFPKDPTVRKRWTIAVRRQGPHKDMQPWLPTDCSIVCYDHFLTSDYHPGHTEKGLVRQRKALKKNAVPSVFWWSKSKTPAQQDREDRMKRRHENQLSILREAAQHEASELKMIEATQPIMDSQFCLGAYEEISTVSGTDNESDVCMETDTTVCPSLPVQLSSCESVESAPPDSNAESHGRNNVYISVDVIRESDKLVDFYTGLETFPVFMTAFWSLGDNVNNLKYAYSKSCACLSPDNQFLLLLVKLRRHYPHFELARMFGVSEFTVENVFVTWINFCHLQWSEINWWPQRSLVHYYCPTDFKRKFPSTRVIIDATEIRVKQPSNPRSQRASFSTYKHANTMKVLVGITPAGLTSYVSPAYAGSTSDRQIVERSPLTILCEKGDSIMADKGFNVQDIFAPFDVEINIPAFFKKKNKMAPTTLQKDRKIASKRVHVERIIGMAKVFTICQHRLNILETKLATQILSVCFYLCNFRKTVVSRFA